MKTWFLKKTALAAVFCFMIAAGSAANPQAEKGPTVKHARGTFEVKMTTQPNDEKGEGVAISRLTSQKQFYGELEGTSKGEMLGAMTAVKGSAGYVAMEKVAGTLEGRSGTFVLQHSGTMSHGSQQLSVTVVPDSGTGQLTGIAGKMTIIIEGGKHSYDFEYTLPGKP